MKDKLISYNSSVSIFQANLQQSFATVSPVPIISGPGLFYYWAGSISYTSTPSLTFGTIGRLRIDAKDNLPLNHDQWLVSSTGTANLVRISEVHKKSVPNHHVSDLPDEIKNDSPAWVKSFVQEKLKNIKER
ncbi:hypothetical protein HY025_00745 [Candidatus Daviesbacteria bacterium]|nr:hypothetical protein [Candidatus Daviesbacteria bacterium]